MTSKQYISYQWSLKYRYYWTRRKQEAGTKQTNVKNERTNLWPERETQGKREKEKSSQREKHTVLQLPILVFRILALSEIIFIIKI